MNTPQRAAVTPPPPPPPVPLGCLLTWEQVQIYLPISRTAFFRGIKAGLYPAATHYGGRAFWHSDDIAEIVAKGPRNGARMRPRGRPRKGPRSQ